jgi:hypothetical protein
MDARTRLLVAGRGAHARRGYAGARLPVEYPDGTVCIPKSQVQIHKSTELASVVFGVPLMLWVATRNRPLLPLEKTGLLALAGGALIVDSMLYSRFSKAKKVKVA